MEELRRAAEEHRVHHTIYAYIYIYTHIYLSFYLSYIYLLNLGLVVQVRRVHPNPHNIYICIRIHTHLSLYPSIYPSIFYLSLTRGLLRGCATPTCPRRVHHTILPIHTHTHTHTHLHLYIYLSIFYLSLTRRCATPILQWRSFGVPPRCGWPAGGGR